MNLTEARKAQHQAEQEAQLLANRIKLLKLEEAKAWKKIQQTKKRASELQSVKQLNFDRFAQQQQVKQNQERQLNQKKFLIVQNRNQRRRDLQQIQVALNQSKKAQASKIRTKSHQLQQTRLIKQHKIRVLNASKHLRVLNQRNLTRHVLKQRHLRVISSVQAEKARKIQNEELDRLAAEKHIMEMEMKEMDLIKKLQNSQHTQKEAYYKLEQALKQKVYNGRKNH